MNFPHPSFFVIVVMAATALFVWRKSRNIRFKEAEESAELNWQRARSNRKAWFRNNPFKSNHDPEGQRLFRIEVGAYMLYLGRKREITPNEEKKYANILESIVPDVHCEEPKKN